LRSDTRCVGASSVISEENARVYYETRQGLVVRRAYTPSNPLDDFTLPRQGVSSVTRPWLNFCYRFANKALRKIKNIMQMIVCDGRQPRSAKLKSCETTRTPKVQGSIQHLLNRSAECTTTRKYSMDRTWQYSHTGIELSRMLDASDNRENRWNCARDPSLSDVQLTFWTGLSRTSVINSVSGSPAQTAGGELCPTHQSNKNASTRQLNPCYALKLMSLYTGHGTQKAALCAKLLCTVAE
jgi:hypothetical protein